MTTEVPAGLQLTIDAAGRTSPARSSTPPALAQVVYSLTSFPTVQSVNGKTRADVEDFVPPILVEQPSPDDDGDEPAARDRQRRTPSRRRSTTGSRTRTATTLAKDFVTATSGSGTRGTFDFTRPVLGRLPRRTGRPAVFELSAEDGSVVHERVIPLRLSRDGLFTTSTGRVRACDERLRDAAEDRAVHGAEAA